MLQKFIINESILKKYLLENINPQNISLTSRRLVFGDQHAFMNENEVRLKTSKHYFLWYNCVYVTKQDFDTHKCVSN